MCSFLIIAPAFLTHTKVKENTKHLSLPPSGASLPDGCHRSPVTPLPALSEELVFPNLSGMDS
jgi:hypothetical protein